MGSGCIMYKCFVYVDFLKKIRVCDRQEQTESGSVLRTGSLCFSLYYIHMINIIMTLLLTHKSSPLNRIEYTRRFVAFVVFERGVR